MNLLAKAILQKAHDGIPLNRKERAIVKYGFTGREVQVLELLATGSFNKEMADILKISLKTVEHHRKTMGSKLPFATCCIKTTHFAIANGFVELMDL